jgi:lysyl-tRNA synthetase class II
MPEQPDTTEAPEGPATESAAERQSRLAAEREHRLGKVNAIRQAGGEPYPYRFERTATAAGPSTRSSERWSRARRPATRWRWPGGCSSSGARAS